MALDPNLLSQLVGVHPARRISFDELHAGLLRGAAEKRINISRDGDLQLFGYTSLCQFEQQWDLFALIARGLILDVAARQVIATPFPKFFNYGEGGLTVPEGHFDVTEKIDGSLGILFHHNTRWRVSTRGQLASEQGQWATAHLHAAVDTAALEPGVTYLVEIVYPENRVVIPYDFAGLVLLCGYDSAGVELPRAALQAVAARAGLRIAGSVACGSIADLLDIAKGLPHNQEGFVLRYSSGLRIKLKGEAYCRVHKLICQCTPLAIWEAMMHGQDAVAMRHDLPEEMRKDFDTIHRLLQQRFDAVIAEVRRAHEQRAGLSDKELGLTAHGISTTLSETQRKFIFACRKQNFLQVVHHSGEWREKVFRHIRPDGNRLEGYVASSAMTRFAEEAG